jgi:hypothetical protein
MCSKAHPWVKASFVRCGGFILSSLNNMEVNVESFDRRKIYFDVSSGRGSNLHLAYKRTQRVLIDPQITTFKPFDRFHC